VTKLLWLKDANYFKKKKRCGGHEGYKRDIELLKIAGLSGWRFPEESEIARMNTVYLNQEPHPFINVQSKYFSFPANKVKNQTQYSHGSFVIDLRNGRDCSHGCCYNGGGYIWPVRGSGSEGGFIE